MKSPLPKLAKDLAALVGIARRETDSATIETALVEARGQIETATRDREAAEVAYRNSLLDAPQADLEVRLAEKATATVRLDRAEALVAALTQRLGIAREAEARTLRKAIHDDAVTKCTAIRDRLPVEYRHHATAIRHLLRDLAVAEVARERAHSEAPDFGQIASPEGELRTLYGLPEDVVERTEIKLFVVDGRTDPVPAERQAAVRRSPEHPHRGMLYLVGNAHPSAPTSGVPLTCTERTFTQTLYREAVDVHGRGLLIRTVSLPGFGLHDPAVVTADPLRDHNGALVELATDLPASTSLKRPIRERLELIPEPPSTREAIVPNEKREPEPRHQPSATQIREANTPSRIAAAERQAG